MAMATEITKNWITPANPTAVINTSPFRREIQNRARKSTKNIKLSPREPVKVMTTTWRMVDPVVNFPGLLMVCPFAPFLPAHGGKLAHRPHCEQGIAAMQAIIPDVLPRGGIFLPDGRKEGASPSP